VTITSGPTVSPGEEPADRVAARLVAQGSTTPVLVPATATEAATGIAVSAAPVLVTPTVAPPQRAADPTDASRAAPVDGAADDTGPVDSATPLGDRLRAQLRGGSPIAGPGLTSLGGVLLGTLVVGAGTLLDLALGPQLGLGFAVTFVVASLLVVVVVRPAALGAAVVLPPLLYAGARVMESRHSGQVHGRRELALDVATSLALHAPTLLVTTAVVAGIALLRLLVHAVRRARS
jgi:hypothetical protein